MDEKLFLNLPLSLSLEQDLGNLCCHRLLRYLPKKRVVYEAEWNGKKVVCKVFFHRCAKRYVYREVMGSRALRAARVLSPRLLYAGRIARSRAHVVIYTYLEQGYPLSAFIPGLQALSYIMKAMAVLAQWQNAGLCYHDIHLDNFYVVNEYLYLLDTASVKKTSTAISLKSGLRELAILLAVCEIRDDSLLLALFKAYVGTRNFTVKMEDFQRVKRWIVQREKKLISIILGKTVRTCTAVNYMKTWQRVSAYDRQYECPALTAFIADPETSIATHTRSVLKSGNTCTVIEALLGEYCVVVKRYNIKNTWHGLKRLFQRSRAYRSWRAAHLLLHYSILTPAPIAMVEKRVGPLRRQAYYLSQYLPGKTLEKALDDTAVLPYAQKRLIQKAIHIIRELRRAHIVHGDMKATNFYVSNGEVYLLDLDSMRQRSGRTFVKQHAKDIQRFMKNWESRPEFQEAFKEVWALIR